MHHGAACTAETCQADHLVTTIRFCRPQVSLRAAAAQFPTHS
jgi:hypothetical protein